MTKSTSLVFLFLISLASTAQISNTIFSNNLNQQKKVFTGKLRNTASSNKQRLDSIVTSLDKYVYTYDAVGNQILRIRYEWDNGSNSWIPYNRFEYEYDAGGNEILYEQYGWDDINNVYVPDFKYERIYDVNKNQTSQITYTWYSSSATWKPIQKFENTFGSNGQISKTDNYNWAGSVLMADNYITFTYNSKQLLAEETQYSLSNTMQSQTSYTYDADDNLTSKTIRNYNVNSEVDSGSKYEYTYDSENNATLSLESEWNTGINDWEVKYKTEYEFDHQHNPTEIIYSDWDDQTSTWMYTHKNIYSFDNTYAITDLIFPEELAGLLKHKLTSIVSYSFVDQDWEQAREYTVYYTSMTTTGNVSAISTDITVYPNPANDRVVFTNKTNDTVTLQLFNELGELVVNNTIIMNQPVSVEGLAKGIYFYRISNTNAVSYNGTLILD